MATVSTEHGPSVEELLPGEAEAFAIAVNQAATQLGKTGKIRPVLIAVRCVNGVQAMLWDMEISSAVARGLEGLQELALIVRRLLSPQGCDLSEMGMPREHWKADGVILVAEGLGVQVDGIAPQSQEPGGVTLTTQLRMLSLEYRVGDRSAVMLYRMDPQGTKFASEPGSPRPRKRHPVAHDATNRSVTDWKIKAMLERFLIAVPLICGQALAAGEAKANDCLFELHTTGEANVTVNLREVSTFRVDRQDGGWQISLELRSGKTQWLHLWQEPGARSIEDFQRTVKRCMR